jgi:quinol monooxygenase YgiN
MSRSSPVSHFVFARAWAGRSELLGERLRTLLAPSRNAAGCLAFDVQRSLQDKDLWLISGIWSSEEAMNAWLMTPQLQVFADVMQGFLASSLDFHTFADAQDVDQETAQRLRDLSASGLESAL